MEVGFYWWGWGWGGIKPQIQLRVTAASDFFSSKLDSKKRQLGRLEEQLQKLEVQATDKVLLLQCAVAYCSML